MTRPLTLVAVPESQREPMSDENSLAFIHANFHDLAEYYANGVHTLLPATELEDYFNREYDGAMGSFLLRVMVTRLCKTPATSLYSPLTVLYCATIADRVGTAVMWAYTLAEETRLNEPVTLDRLSELFPVGFPTEEGAGVIWDAQKQPDAPLGNALDRADAWNLEPETVDAQG